MYTFKRVAELPEINSTNPCTMNIDQRFFKRRHVTAFIRKAGALSILLGVIWIFSSAYMFKAPVPSHQAPKQAPNILVFIADDWGYPHAGVYGDTVVKTPNFD